jgi:hypothetical protein
MTAMDLGSEALLLLRRRLGVGPGWISGEAVHWSYWGALQSAWSEPVRARSGAPAWRVRLATRLVEGFSTSPQHTAALASILPQPSLGGLVMEGNRLDIMSAVDIDDHNVGSMVQVLTMAARAHVADARHLVSGTKRLAPGLISLVDTAARLPDAFLDAPMLREAPGREGSWSTREIATCVDALRKRSEPRAVETPWGVSATFALDWTNEVRSVLEVRPDSARPLFGRGIGATLWTMVRGGPRDALQWNARETGPGSNGDALGGWWAPEGGFLVHRSFYPGPLCQADLLVQFLQASVHRARAANTYVAARE